MGAFDQNSIHLRDNTPDPGKSRLLNRPYIFDRGTYLGTGIKNIDQIRHSKSFLLEQPKSRHRFLMGLRDNRHGRFGQKIGANRKVG